MDVSKESERVIAVERMIPGLSKRYLESNGTFITIESYLINYFPNDMEFVAEKFAPVLEARANEADQKFRTIKDEIYSTTLSDAKYREPVQKTENKSMTFIDYVESLAAYSITKDGVRFGNTIKSYESLYSRFVEDRYNAEELEEINTTVIDEPSKEEQDKAIKQYKARKVLEAVLNKNGMDVTFVLSNSQFVSNFFEEFLDSIEDIDKSISDGSLTSQITDLLSKYIIAKNDTTSVDRLEEMEILDNGRTITTKTLMQLEVNEIAALVEEYSKKPNIASSGIEVTMNGGDDDEEIETIEEPEIEVTLKAK